MTHSVKSYLELSATCHWFQQAAWATLTHATTACSALKRQWHIPLHWQPKVILSRTWWLLRKLAEVNKAQLNYTLKLLGNCLSMNTPQNGYWREGLIKLGSQGQENSDFVVNNVKNKSPSYFLLCCHSSALNWDPKEEKLTSTFSAFCILGTTIEKKWQTKEVKFAI